MKLHVNECTKLHGYVQEIVVEEYGRCTDLIGRSRQSNCKIFDLMNQGI
jgi:hypothetical protein